MISEHSAHLTPLSVDFRTWLWRYTYLLLLISMLWHRQAIFKSKGDKLCSSAECRIWTRDPRHQIVSRLNARWQTDWPIEDQAKNLNSTARPYDQRAFSPLDPTVSWLSHLALAIYIIVIRDVNSSMWYIHRETQSIRFFYHCKILASALHQAYGMCLPTMYFITCVCNNVVWYTDKFYAACVITYICYVMAI